MFVSTEALAIIALYAGGLWWARMEAVDWLKRKGPELNTGPMRYYTVTMASVVTSTLLMLYRIYTDWSNYHEPDIVILIAWIVFLLGQAWIMWHVVPRDYALMREFSGATRSTPASPPPQPHRGEVAIEGDTKSTTEDKK
jgi:hypothetical protein